VTVKDFERFLKSGDVETIKMGFTFAEEAGVGDEAMEMLCEPLGDADDYVRRPSRDAARALGEIGDARAVEPLIKALGDEDEDVCMNAAEALGEIGDTRAVGPLIKNLSARTFGRSSINDTKTSQLSATWALADIGVAAVEPLIKALGDEDDDVRWLAADALGEIGDERAVEPLIKALRDDNVHCAAEALGNIGDVRAVEPLIKALEDEEWRVRYYAARALIIIMDARAVEPLIGALEDETWAVRGNAAYALGEIGDARAVEPLIKVLGDESDEVRDAAKEALKKLGHEVE
jgi:HEAT repeat protein